MGKLHEGFCVLRSNYHCHTLLGFGNGQLRAVQTVIFFRYLVQVDEKSVCQLSDGNGNTAGTEIVTALDHTGGLRIPEQTLQLSLLRCITLLDLRTAGLYGVKIVGLGGTGGSAAAVTAGTASQKDDHISRKGAFPSYIFCRSGCHNGTDLHTLCGIAVMIQLVYDTRGKADLVSVGGIACRCRGNELSLGKLAGKGLGKGPGGICGTGHAHGVIYIGTTGKGIPDGTADTGGCSTEGLDLRRMVMGLVLKEQEPVLILSVHIDLDLYGAGVDLLGLVQLLQLSFLPEILSSQGGDVHEVHGLCAV